MSQEKIRRCQTCQGNGILVKEVKPGVWREVPCPACGGTGKIIISTI